MSILPLLRSAGPLPIDEIWGRSPDSDDELLGELISLQQDGLIEIVEGEMPRSKDDLRRAKSIVHLTHAGAYANTA